MLDSEDIDGRFRIEAEVASGGMGTVYRGRDLESGSLVALKILKSAQDADAERFSREASLLARVSHPGVVKYLAHGTVADGRPFLVMEWVDGETLRDRLRRKGLNIVETVAMARRVTEALGEMHRQAILHRDVKPSNLIFPGCAVDRVKLLDFGIARRSDDLVGLTGTGMMVGSPGYMAPEQARGDRTLLDARADLFALGCVLYECLTGQPPFFGEPMAVRAKVLLADPPDIRGLNGDVSPALQDLVHQLLSKDRELRPLNAAELSKRLATLQEVSGTPRREQEARQDSTQTSSMRPRAPAWKTGEDEPMTFLVLAGAEDALDQPGASTAAEDKGERRRALELAVASHGGQLECLDGRWWMVVLPSRGLFAGDEAERAAFCALQIRGVLPEAPMAVVAERSASRLDALIDRGVKTVTSTSIASMFAEALTAPALDGGIRLDDATVSLLQADRFQLTQSAEGTYLRPKSPGF